MAEFNVDLTYFIDKHYLYNMIIPNVTYFFYINVTVSN